MIWRALALAAAMTAAGYAQARTIVARSGEHDGFSRLVMRLPAGADWSLTQSGQSATLNIDSPDAVFDTSRVFNLIPRTRLLSLDQTAPGGPLRLQLGCDCQLTSYVQKDGYLVVDIRDGARKPVYSTGSTVLPLGRETLSSGYRFNLSQDAIVDARLALDVAAAVRGIADGSISEHAVSAAGTEQAAPAEPAPAALPLSGRHAALDDAAGEMAEPSTGALPDAGLLLNMDETARAAAVNASEERLLQQIGRATNQGLLDLAVADMQIGGADQPLDPLGMSDRPLDPLAHISVSSAIDRETGLVARRPENEEASHCRQDSSLAIYNWGTDSSFADQVGPLRSALVREFDDVNPASVLTLSKTYLYFGFGAEALAMLQMMPEASISADKAAALAAMGAMLDGRSLPINHPFAGQQPCDGDAAFWAALADGSIKRGANTDAIQQTFAKMPPHLRVHFGPRLSTLFAEAGESHMAEAALRSVDRTGAEHVPEINLAEAAIADLSGDAETVAEKLTDEVADRTENAPQALIDLIDLSFKERKALSPDVPDLVASYELESRETDLGATLRRAEVAALALTGLFHDAFDELKELTRDDGPAARAQALEPLMTLLAERADDVTFLQYALVFSGQATAAEAAPVADKLARRLLDLGFAEQAQSVLKKLALEEGNENRRLMMAEAALALEMPHRALVELMGLESSEANRLRAEALWRNGEYGRAGEYMLAEKETNAAARGFWHSEDLDAIDSIGPQETLPFQQVAGVTGRIGETVKDPQGLPPLAHARALVESSVGTRGGIEDLLQKLTAGEMAAGTDSN